MFFVLSQTTRYDNMEERTSILPQPIITPKEARKLLGKTSESFTDDELIGVVNHMAILSKTLLEWALGSTNQHRGV